MINANWLVEVVIVEGDNDNKSLGHIGRLLAFAWARNAEERVQVCYTNAMFTAYKLWFWFKFEENKVAFLNLVREAGYRDLDDEDMLTPPSILDELPPRCELSSVFTVAALKRIRDLRDATLADLPKRRRIS